MTYDISQRRNFLKLGAGGLAGGAALVAAGASMTAREAAAQSAEDSLLRTVLDRGHVIVGTGSTNAPWHFEDEAGNLVGMDITMAKILAVGLFEDETKIEFVRQDPAARIPNIATGKVDISIQFMTITPQRAQLVAFTRPYYVEGIALLSKPDAARKTYDEMLAAGTDASVSILQNVDAEVNVHKVLPEATVMQLDTQANVVQALESGRVDGAAVDLSTVRWMVAQSPDKYYDAGKKWFTMLYGAAVRQNDPDWLGFVDWAFTVAMFGHQNELYDAAFKDFFGLEPPVREPGFPTI